MRRFTLLSSAVTLACGLCIPVAGFAAVQSAVTIEQVSPKAQGTWTLAYADGTSISSKDAGINAAKHSFSITNFVPLTLSATPPQGMTTKITVYRNGDPGVIVTIPQYSFTPLPNEKYRFLIQYVLSELGSIGLTSSPSSARFRLSPSLGGRSFNGATPTTLTNIPAGAYKLTFAATAGCTSPAPKTVVIKSGEQSNVFTTLSCVTKDSSDVSSSRISKRSIVESALERETKPRGQRK